MIGLAKTAAPPIDVRRNPDTTNTTTPPTRATDCTLGTLPAESEQGSSQCSVPMASTSPCSTKALRRRPPPRTHLQPRLLHRDRQAHHRRRARRAAHLDPLRGAAEADHADGPSAVHSAYQRFLQEVENHAPVMALHFLHYNFAQPHPSLGKRTTQPWLPAWRPTLGRSLSWPGCSTARCRQTEPLPGDRLHHDPPRPAPVLCVGVAAHRRDLPVARSWGLEKLWRGRQDDAPDRQVHGPFVRLLPDTRWSRSSSSRATIRDAGRDDDHLHPHRR